MTAGQGAYAVTTDLEFTRGFPARDPSVNETSIDELLASDGPSISDTDEALARRFRAVALLADVIDYIATYETTTERATDQPELGILTTDFLVAEAGERPGPATHRRHITPMGANPDVLLGCLNLPTPVAHAYRPIEQGEIIHVFGTDVAIGSSQLAYAVLNRREVRAGGMGLIQYPGRLAVFSRIPEKDQLHDFAQSIVPGTSDFHISRIDATVQTVNQAQDFRR